MSKPYTLTGFNEMASAASGKASKNVTVTCNSVMGNPRKLGKKLIRRGSTTEIREDSSRFSPRSAGAHAYSIYGLQQNGCKPPMVRMQTADNGDLRYRCTSDENVAAAHQFDSTVSPLQARKFVKRKSSADLLLTSSETPATTTLVGRASTQTTTSTFSAVGLDRIATGFSPASSAQLSKAEKKRLEKLKENMKLLSELFTAVEQDDIGKVRSMLQHNELDVNGTNMDDLNLLDVATMLNHTEVALLLIKYGAQENSRFTSVNHRIKHIQTLVDSAQAKLAELTLSAMKQAPLSSASANNLTISLSSSASSTSIISKSLDKQISSWESRLHVLKKMRNCLDQCAIPGQPKNVQLQVTSSTSLMVSFEPPDQMSNVVTKYKIEWSLDENFSEIAGSLLVKDLRRLESTIINLTTGAPYYIRVSAGNFKGFCEPCACEPNCAIPSSWRDIDQKMNRSAGRLESITELFHELRKLKKTDLWERIAYTGDAALKKKKSGTMLRNLFSSTMKFQRNLKRGVYLATILYKDDKILCTVDDCLPVVEVDETVPSSLAQDFQWFMKLSCAWEDMRSLHLDVDHVNQSPGLIFRLKLLEAAAAMQAGLGVQDLGRLHSTPVIDNKGVTVLVTVQYVHDSKMVQGLAVKWMSMNKLFKKQTSIIEKEMPAMDLLVNGLINFLNFYESTYIPLDRGLYLCYVKLHSSMNQISIVVPENLPSVLPFVYIRENPHVCKEEWDWLRMLGSNETEEKRPTPSQLAFHWSVTSAAKVLLSDLDIGEDQIATHRVYNLEVVEIHSDVSFILLVPAHSEVCSAPGQSKLIGEEKRGCVALPVPMFEVAHLCTYQPDFIALYCRLSVFLDFYVIVLQQLQRQTLNEDEAKTFKQLVDILNAHQQRLEEVWKSARWISAVATAARDRQLRSGLPLVSLFSYSNSIMPKSVSSNVLTAIPGQKGSKVSPIPDSCHALQKRDIADRNTPCTSNGQHQSTSTRSHTTPRAQNRLTQQRRRVSSSGDQSLCDPTEENSDVGYHSDQSVEKMAAASAQNATVACMQNENTCPRTAPLPMAAENPTYDFPERLLTASRVTADVRHSRHTYVNLPNGDTVTDQRPSGSSTSMEKTVLYEGNMDYLLDKLNSVQKSAPTTTRSKMIQARYGNPVNSAKQPASTGPASFTYHTQIAVGESVDGRVLNVIRQSETDDDGASSSTSTSTIPLAQRRRTHDYVNFGTLPVAASGPPRRKFGSCSMVLSDSELSSSSSDARIVNRQRSTSPAASSRSQKPKSIEEEPFIEDLSVIDKLYAEAAAAITRSSPVAAQTPATLKRSVASPRPPSSASSAGSVASSSDKSKGMARTTSTSSPQAGVLRVYAAYPCGLAKGTSVKLHVTPKTSSREVVTLVVRQLNKAVEVKGLKEPFYGDEELGNFVLVAVIGARERCLRDDYAPLELQNPWCKGKLFVRRKNDLLAALEYGNEAKV